MKDTLVQLYGTWYIDPMRFLQCLVKRANLVLERIAVPGTDYATTEALRGHYAELKTLIQQLTENTK